MFNLTPDQVLLYAVTFVTIIQVIVEAWKKIKEILSNLPK
jgi:hypothetical protein